MVSSKELPGPLYHRLIRLRRVLPLAAGLIVLVQEIVMDDWLASFRLFQNFASEVLFYTAVWTVVGWLFLTMLARAMRERGQAEARLRSLYEISRQVVVATDTQELVDIALRMLEPVVDPVGTTVTLQDHPTGPWRLAGVHSFQSEHRDVLEACLVSASTHMHCRQCTTLSSMAWRPCPLLAALPEDLKPAVGSLVCLPLSTEQPPHALLNVYLPEETALTDTERQMLESMTSTLAVALDHARLRTREIEMLQHMEEAVRQGVGLTNTLEHVLADIATVNRADMGVAFLASRSNGDSTLIPVASWPGEEFHPHLATLARKALGTATVTAAVGPGNSGHAAALPLVVQGVIIGALVLAGQHPFASSESAVLSAAAGMMALMVRNTQLYAELERQAILEERSRIARRVHDGLAQSLASLNLKVQETDRLLVYERWADARQALRELREGIQSTYADVRVTIQDLRWPFEDGQGLVECLDQCVAASADLAGLEVSLIVEGEPNLSPRAEVHIFRIVQEALVNIRRHAQARRAWVRLLSRPEGMTLEVEDDGIGLPAEYRAGELPGEPAGHFGLRIIRERVEAIGGQLSLSSVSSAGTKLRVTLPPSDTSAQSI